MKKILVASDFSACAANAMEYAMHLAHILGFEITVINAIGTTEGVANNTYNALYIEEYYNNKRTALADWAKTFAGKESYENVAVSTICEVGTVSGVITKYISSNPIELLVMGTMGSTGISGLFGSNTNTMISKTRTPTLVIPLESKFSPNPVVTLATDFAAKLSHSDVNALNELVLAFKLQKLEVLNVIEGKQWKTNLDGENSLKDLIPHAELEFNYVSENNTMEGIMNFIKSNDTDILCLVKHHYSVLYRIFNSSTVNKVTNKAIKAVLVLHEEE